MRGAPTRLFVAVFPPEVLDRIDTLPRLVDPRRVRWTRREQWHVTLRFLGQADVDAAVAAMSRIDGERVQVTLGPVVAEIFPGVVGLKVSGLDQLAAATALAMTGVGDGDEERTFVGHLTLARTKERGLPDLVGARFEAGFVVEGLALVRSTLGPDGAAHEIVTRRELGP